MTVFLNLLLSNFTSNAASDCGRSCARKPFVARGDVTHAGKFPWQAMLCTASHGQHCGGVLVSDNCIVTAAHCLHLGGVFTKNVSVCVGRQCGNCSEVDVEGNPQCFRPKSTFIHPNFSRSTLDNDIAIIRLPKAVSCHCNSVFPVCLPNEKRDGSYLRAGMEGIVTGWGRVNSSLSRSTCLRKGDVRLASRNICSKRHPDYPITNSMMCATDYNGACEGDSGGPLVIKNKEYGHRFVLAGIVSWGKGCGQAKGLGVYTKVLTHVNWIKQMCGMNS